MGADQILNLVGVGFGTGLEVPVEVVLGRRIDIIEVFLQFVRAHCVGVVIVHITATGLVEGEQTGCLVGIVLAEGLMEHTFTDVVVVLVFLQPLELVSQVVVEGLAVLGLV